MKLWEISKLMNADRLFKVSDNESVDTETGEGFDKEYPADGAGRKEPQRRARHQEHVE